MRKVCLLIGIILFSITHLSAQYKNDKWIVGVTPLIFEFKSDSVLNKFLLDSNTINPSYKSGHSLISDSSNIIFSCNGFKLYDNLNQVMENSDNIVPQNLEKYIGTSQYKQHTLILPKSKNQFYQFYWGISDNLFDSIQNGYTSWRYDILLYNIIDMGGNNGNGKVISKMNYLLEYADLSASQMSAVRHANGRDWWLVKPHNKKHLFYTFLVTYDGIIPQPIQEFESPIFKNGINGQSNFSPDGSLYAITSESSIGNFSQINYFDRCTGKMKKLKTLYSPFEPFWNDTARINSICISSNNRFVYLINNFFIYQYDLTNDEIIELHTDSLYNQCEYKSAYNASDGRIYIGNFLKQCDAMSYIEFPNNKGKAAGLCQLCYKTKNNNTAVPPNMPNYELGALVGSPCDTIKPYIEPPPPVTSANILVPNAISPNGDGKNDTWHILNVPQLQNAGITLQAVGVYNRWGNEVFKSSDINFVWKPSSNLASDTYYYYIRYRTQAGTSQVMKGSVSVVR